MIPVYVLTQVVRLLRGVAGCGPNPFPLFSIEEIFVHMRRRSRGPIPRGILDRERGETAAVHWYAVDRYFSLSREIREKS